MRTSLGLITLISIGCFLTSCGFMLKPEKRQEVKIPTTGTPQAFQLEDPDCILGASKPKFSKNVKIWLIDQLGELREQSFDLSDVSRAGLESSSVSEALYSQKDIDRFELMADAGFKPRSLFKDIKALQAMKQEHEKGTFSRIDFCRAEGGYKPDSIENAALAAFVAIHETNQMHAKIKLRPGVKKNLKKIKLFVHPKIFALQNKYLKEFYVDNAFWSDFGSFQMIAVLPHSQEWEATEKLRFWETPGVFSHEYGHHIFHTYGPSLEFPIRNFLYRSQLFRINNGFNEGFADLISYFSLSERKQFNPALLLTGDTRGHQNRDVKTPNLEYVNRNLEISIPKRYDAQVAEILGSTYSYKKSQLDPEGYHIQECHESGAIMAYVFNQMMDQYGFLDEPLKKMELLITWLDLQDYSMFAKDEYTSPQTHLETLLNGLTKLLDEAKSESKLEPTEEQKNELIMDLFPYYYSKWIDGVE